MRSFVIAAVAALALSSTAGAAFADASSPKLWNKHPGYAGWHAQARRHCSVHHHHHKGCRHPHPTIHHEG
jgi:hypothetical protein